MQSQSFSGVSIHIHTREAIDGRVIMTHTHTHPCLSLILRVYKPTHTHISGRFFIALPGALPLHTHKQLCAGNLFNDDTYTHPYPRLIACTTTYFSFTFTRVFPLHACGVTRSWPTYFTSVRRAFLVETVVLQTVL